MHQGNRIKMVELLENQLPNTLVLLKIKMWRGRGIYLPDLKVFLLELLV